MKMSFFTKFNNNERGFDSLLPYIGFVSPGVLFLKTGGFCASFEIRGRDLSSSTDIELGQVSKIINFSLRNFGDGWISNIDTIRREIKYYPNENECFFPDPVTKLIDASRRQIFESSDSCFENKYYLTLIYTPPSAITKRMIFLFENDDSSLKDKDNDLNKSLQQFEESINKFLNIFSSEMHTRKLDDEEMLTYLHSCITGLKHHVAMPIIPIYLDCILASKDFIGGFKPKIGNKYIKAISIKSFPSYLNTAILNELNNLTFEFRFSTRFIFLSQASSKKFIEDKRKEWDQSKNSFKNILTNSISSRTSTHFLSGDAIHMALDADKAVDVNQRNDIGFGFFTSTIILMDEDAELLENNAKEVTQLMERLGFPCLIERINAVEAYLGSIPALTYANVRKPLISTHNYSHLIPTTAVWSGDAVHPNKKYKDKETGKSPPPMFYGASKGRTPFLCSLHVDDTGHVLIIGPTGSGKTTLLGFIAAQQFRYKNARVFMFDKKRSQYVLCKASGGSFYEISPSKYDEEYFLEDQNISFCPLADIDDVNSRTWAVEWISTIFELQHHKKISIDQRDAIAQVIYLMSKETKTPYERRLSKFASQVQDLEVRSALKQYIDPNQFGSIFDGTKDFVASSRFCVFETDNLMDKKESVVILALEYIFRVIEKKLDGSPTFLILDEAWTFLGHETFLRKIEKWLRELRKHNCAVVFATQSVSEIKNSPIVSILLESCKTKIYLSNPTANSNELTYAAYQSFGLNKKQIEIITNAESKREYYLNSDIGNKLFEIMFDKLTLAFVGVSDISEIIRAKEFIKNNKETWIVDWLKYNEINEDWIGYYKSLLTEGENIL